MLSPCQLEIFRASPRNKHIIHSKLLSFIIHGSVFCIQNKGNMITQSAILCQHTTRITHFLRSEFLIPLIFQNKGKSVHSILSSSKSLPMNFYSKSFLSRLCFINDKSPSACMHPRGEVDKICCCT